MFVVAKDVDLLDGQFTPSLHIVTEKHLTEAAYTQNTALFPLRWRHRH